jgi:EAL domain-containing protein (putative c-di-GMP-specific phosphodiesterase class I)
VLRLAGCNELQGFYFHKPMSDVAIKTLLDAQGAAGETSAEFKRSA